MSDMINSMIETLSLKEVDIRTYSPLTLAYIGDGVFELIIRSYAVSRGNMPVNKLHRFTSNIVKAQAQSEMIQAIEPMLTEEEEDIYKRGRNAKSYTSAKNATIGDYRKATGFEALVGYLYLMKRYDRLMELVKLSLEKIGEIK